MAKMGVELILALLCSKDGYWMTPEREARHSVLIVEDDPAVARILRVCLRRAGFDTSEAETGRQALKVLEERRPDAVLLDLGLPDGLGGAVLKRLHESPDGYPTWLIVSALDKDEAVPVDTHVRQLAHRLFLPELKAKTITDNVYKCISCTFGSRYGKYAGWAQQFLFYEDLLRGRREPRS